MKKIKFSPSMEKSLFEIKDSVMDHFNQGLTKGSYKIKKKPTKNKTLLAVTMPLDKPAFQLFINDKFYKSYFYYFNENRWIEVE